MAYPRALAQAGFAAAPVQPYAVGRLVLWSASLDARQLRLSSLTDPKITRIAIANPKHAPYGQRAVEALQAAGVAGGTAISFAAFGLTARFLRTPIPASPTTLVAVAVAVLTVAAGCAAQAAPCA
ncbi:solute-binding protein [bacterium]|nr:solute-binding protein [bacterium]